MASKVRGHAGLSRKQEEVIAALLSAITVDQAAHQAGIGYRTLMRWLKEDVDFQEAYRLARKQIVQQSQSRLQQATGHAVATLIDVMNDPLAPPGAKVTAARVILEHAIKAVEIDDLEARIQILEQAIGKPGLNGASLVR